MEQYNDYSLCKKLMGHDEQILWTGQPKVEGIFSSVPLSSYIGSIVWTIVCLFMFKLVRSTAIGSELYFLPVWALFVGVGIYGLIVWPFQSYYQQKKTVYVITNKRIYRQRGRQIKKLSIAEMNGYYTNYNKNGTGTIIFPLTTMLPWATRPYHSEYKLENIPDIDHALQAISRMDHTK